MMPEQSDTNTETDQDSLSWSVSPLKAVEAKLDDDQ